MSDQKTEQKPDHEKRIREALEAGPTEGEWRRGNAGASVVSDQHVEHGPIGCDCVEYYGGHLIAESINGRNLAYIAACNPSAIRALLADLDAMRGALKSVQAAIYMDDAGQLRLTRSFDESTIDAALKGASA